MRSWSLAGMLNQEGGRAEGRLAPWPHDSKGFLTRFPLNLPGARDLVECADRELPPQVLYRRHLGLPLRLLSGPSRGVGAPVA